MVMQGLDRRRGGDNTLTLIFDSDEEGVAED
jgi:hypothetical protein